MQKFNKKASILLWSIILSLVLSIIFISISNKINLNLKQNINISKNSDDNEKLENNLQKIENIFKEIKTLTIENKYNEIDKKFEEIENLKNLKEDFKINIDLKNENYFLENNKDLEIILPKNTTINVKIFWWKIFYDENGKTWEIEDFKNFYSENESKKIIFTNKSWEFLKIDIISSSYIISPKKYFQILEKFSWKEIFKKDWFLQIN